MKKTINFEDGNRATIYICDCCGKTMFPFVNTLPGEKNIDSGYKCFVCGYTDGLSCDTVPGRDFEGAILERQEAGYND